MRLVFSTILAAALVFGGTLFLARHKSPNPYMNLMLICPSVDQILSKSIPEEFVVHESEPEDVVGNIEWRDAGVALTLSEDGNVSGFGDEGWCYYSAPTYPDKRLGISEEFALGISSEFEIVVEDMIGSEHYWHLFPSNSDHGITVIVCEEARESCRFHVRRRKGEETEKE